MTRSRLLFLLMCTIWGLTWIAIKTGVDAVPPLFFAAVRLVTAGALLLLLARSRGAAVRWHAHPGRTILAALLVNTATYGLLFWGMQHVASGVSAIINLSMVPVGLFVIGVLAGEETFTSRKLGALGVGVAGLSLLFYPELSAREAAPALAGMLAILGGTLAYCAGSVLSRRLLRETDVLGLGGVLSLTGGLGLAIISALTEPVDAATVSAFLSAPVIASWLFLVLGGSVAAFTIYLRLLRDWGPARAGLYAFVSPVVAVLVGVVLLGESFGGFEAAGSAMMLGAAALAMGES